MEIYQITTWTLLAALVIMIYVCGRLVRALHVDQDIHSARLSESAKEASHYLAIIRRYEKVLAKRVGGVGKRISECREITECILEHAPDLFIKDAGLVYWLQATDEFLTDLYVIYREFDSSPDHCANSRSRLVYDKVHEITGLPLVPGRAF